MQKPHLIIIAGCNGSGKSTYSQSFTDKIIPFDYDKQFLVNYESLLDSDIRDVMASNLTINQFTEQINTAFEAKKSFCYETNFHENPLFWAKKAKELGYQIDLIFFCLSKIEIAEKRVYYRTKNLGHFVSNKTIKERWKLGYKNANLYFSFFDYVLFLDNSRDYEKLTYLFEIIKKNENEIELRKFVSVLPRYVKTRFPAIFDLIS